MMTPESIASKRFDKQMGGYKQDDVERFLSQVAEDYSRIQAEKEELEAKIEVLAEKIEQYREDEDSLRNALIGAQKLGDSVIRESKAKAEAIVREAKTKTDKMLESSQKSIEKEHIALVKMQKEVTKFKNRLLTLYKQHLEMISALPDYDQEDEEVRETQKQQPLPPPPQQEEPIVKVVAPDRQVEPEHRPEPQYQPEKQESKFFFDEEDDEKTDIQHHKAQEEVHTEQPAYQNQMYRNEIDTGMVIDFNSAIEHQEMGGNISVATAQKNSRENSDSSKFGPLKFGEGFDVERDSAGKSLFSKKKHR